MTDPHLEYTVGVKNLLQNDGSWDLRYEDNRYLRDVVVE
jgi:hypothetical protein